MLLGCVADDFTGATDLATTLVKQGMRTVQVIGVPEDGQAAVAFDAVVVALKTRTAPVGEAVDESCAALRWLRDAGARQYFFKYCSTFDSTARGNIGPVADALLREIGADFTIACPAFPTNQRTVYQGHLFVGDRLLHESGMQNHPLTPMTDADLVRVLGAQTKDPVGLVPYASVAAGSDAISNEYARLRADGCRYAIVDAVNDADLHAIGAASADLQLLTGGSGVALGLPANFRSQGLLASDAQPGLRKRNGRQAVLAGSCSQATLAQVAYAAERWQTHSLDPVKLHGGAQSLDELLRQAAADLDRGPVLVYSTADPDTVQQAQSQLGRQTAAELVEAAMGRLAGEFVQVGVDQLVVAGGETAGAVVQALDIKALHIGPEIDPGVPWCETLGSPDLALALKSGNFGGEDFFVKAFGMLND
ncbi:MAG: four-carbon acid sugar kinase family protein [Gammaproteobacteria bacterium]|nr:four-carbon acid sugar kinase family protein [Gammaproteobacteria bacterium]